MKIYIEKDTEVSCAEVLFSHEELKAFVDSLVKFESRIEQYKLYNEGKSNLGFTHLHFIDCNKMCEKSKSDLIFYVNLSGDGLIDGEQSGDGNNQGTEQSGDGSMIDG